jgi:hypothetical protein
LSWKIRSNNHGEKHTYESEEASHENYRSHKCNKSAEFNPEEDLAQDQVILAYPNPVLDKVYISHGDITVSQDITVFNMKGERFNFKARQSDNSTLEIDFSAMKSGLYLIQIKSDNELKVLRIVKL